LIIHESIYDKLVQSLLTAYKSVKIGDPLEASTLMGPLHTKSAIKEYLEGIEVIKQQGGKVLYGGQVHEGFEGGNYVYPTLIEIDPSAEIIKTELFVPILHLLKVKNLEEAI
jgi:aldehyde dehydrogenase family 7 protein A1